MEPVKSVAQSFVMRARGVKQTDLAPLHEPHGEIAPGGWMPFKFTPSPVSSGAARDFDIDSSSEA